MSFANDFWATIIVPGGRLEFQPVPGCQPPRWPDRESSSQQHLDFYVDDRAAREARVLGAGATKYDFQPNDQCTVFADPAGRVCLSTWETPS